MKSFGFLKCNLFPVTRHVSRVPLSVPRPVSRVPNFVPFLFLLLTLLPACSPQRRLQRLVVHHPELRIADTLLIRDTIIRASVETDTTLALTRLSDTVIITRDRLEISLVKVHDTIHIRGTCKADTIIRELRIPVEKFKLVKAEAGWLSRLWWIIAGLIVVAILLKFGTRDTGRNSGRGTRDT